MSTWKPKDDCRAEEWEWMNQPGAEEVIRRHRDALNAEDAE
jgi:hypothetical protein